MIIENGTILVLGIGNLLMGDEGIGVHAIRYLETLKWPEDIHFLDGGTGGFHLMSYIESYPDVIVIDATMDGSEEGTIQNLKPRYASDFPRTLSSHDIGLKDLIESMALLSTLPRINLITVSIKKIQMAKAELSETLQNCLPEISERVRKTIQEITGQH